MKGRFITVEGADGSGKTTHLDFMQRWLSERGAQVVRTREPGGTALGELLRGILLDNADTPMSARAELMLIFAARTQHLDEVIVPALEAGRWVLCDRFTDATYAYQGGGRGIAAEAIEALEHWAQGALSPDLTVLLDVPVEVGLARAQQRDGDTGQPDRFESQSNAFKQAVRDAYLARAERFARRIKRVDARAGIERVRAELATVLETFWAERAP